MVQASDCRGHGATLPPGKAARRPCLRPGPPPHTPWSALGATQPGAPAPTPPPYACGWFTYLAATDYPDLPPPCSLLLGTPLLTWEGHGGETLCLRVTHSGPGRALQAPKAP